MARELVGYKIREARKTAGITQSALAKQVGISPSYLNLIEANRRPIAGKLLNALADELSIDLDSLTGKSEQRLIDDLITMASDPLLNSYALDRGSIEQLVGRSPLWARSALAIFRAYRDQSQAVTALSDRLNQDPFLNDAVHQMLTQITAIRSASEILDSVEDLEADQQKRFHTIISHESNRLSKVAQSLAEFFEKGDQRSVGATPIDEVDDFIIGRGNYFPKLEQSAHIFQQKLEGHGETVEAALMEFLHRRHRISVQYVMPESVDLSFFRNQCTFVEATRTFLILNNSSISTRRFQLARLAAEVEQADIIAEEIDDPNLTTDESRIRAQRAMASYSAGALLFPYERFLSDAENARYDIEILRQRYSASFEQICHRLTTLHAPDARGIPFALLRTNPAGHTTKRFPVAGLMLPQGGRGCPLWAIYTAFQTPGRVTRRLAEFPDGGRFLFIARTVTKQPATFREQQFLYAVMLATDTIHADKTVYADGLDLTTRAIADPVGTNCRLCVRTNCLQREEEAIIKSDG
jgi:predicted transcriptional regulator/transcriptional regulator with XRE-family HTH domain